MRNGSISISSRSILESHKTNSVLAQRRDPITGAILSSASQSSSWISARPGPRSVFEHPWEKRGNQAAILRGRYTRYTNTSNACLVWRCHCPGIWTITIDPNIITLIKEGCFYQPSKFQSKDHCQGAADWILIKFSSTHLKGHAQAMTMFNPSGFCSTSGTDRPKAGKSWTCSRSLYKCSLRSLKPCGMPQSLHFL